VLLLGLLLLDAAVSQGIDREGVRQRQAIVKVQGLTDPCFPGLLPAVYTLPERIVGSLSPFQINAQHLYLPDRGFIIFNGHPPIPWSPSCRRNAWNWGDVEKGKDET
jgi:hypothetical protein